MVGTLDVAVQAQNPQNPLFPLVAYEKSSSSVRIRNVPKKIGSWNITSVVLAAQYPDNTTKVASCVLVGGIWVGTIAGSEDVGEGVYTIYASGIDENGQPVNDYCLGSGQVTILAQEVRRDANAPVHMLYEEPTAEIREGDLFQSGETSAWMIFKDGQSVPIAEVYLTDYYKKSETSSASEISTAFENIDLSDCIKYPVLDAQTNEWTLSIAPQGDGIEDEQKVVFCSYEQSVPGQYTTYMQLGDGAPIAVTRDAPASAATGYARLKVGTQIVPIFRDMPTKTSQLSNDSEFPTPDNPGRFLRYTAYPSDPNRWIVNFGSSSTGGISLVSDGDHPISSYIDIAGRKITAGGEDQQAVHGRLASVGLQAANPSDYIAVNDRPLAYADNLSDYYQKSETSSASEISTAFENIDLSDYVEKASLSDYYQKSETSSAAQISTAIGDVSVDTTQYYTKSETSSASEISTAFENIDLSGYATKDDISSLSDAVKFETAVGGGKTAVTIGQRLAGSIVGVQSLAVGGGNTAAGTQSMALGVGVEAVGKWSFAGGNYSTASGDSSFAWGSSIRANSPLEASFGRLNKSHVYDSSLSNEASATIFSVGVGGLSGNERANGLEVMVNGDTYLKGLGGYDGAELSNAIPLQQMFGTQFTISGEYEDDTTFEISVYGYTPPPPPPAPSDKLFTMTNIGDSDQTFIMNNVGQFLEYSTDGGETWSQYSGSTQVTVPSGGSVKLRHLSSSGDFSPRNLNVQGSTGQWKASGNIMTLLDETGERTVLSDGFEFQYMFSDGSSNIVNIVDASELELPATTLANYCYSKMFMNCTSLTAAPAELPATTISGDCYMYMFWGCQALTASPYIKGQQGTGCAQMFKNCSSLVNISVDLTAWPSPWGNYEWVMGTPRDGTFYCPASLGTDSTITRDYSYCPPSWTVVNI